MKQRQLIFKNTQENILHKKKRERKSERKIKKWMDRTFDRIGKDEKKKNSYNLKKKLCEAS